MALVKGNISSRAGSPGATFFTKAHTHNTGADGFLVVMVSVGSSYNDVSATYNNVAMTKIQTGNSSSVGRRVSIYVLQNPPTGSNKWFND